MNNVIQPGLERITQLLQGTTELPWKAIHVAGTNGKGSICHHAAALLKRRAIRAGKFSTPHLVNRWDSIMINQKPANESEFKRVETHFKQVNQARDIGASPFEILTATAFTMFTNAKVKVGIVEVGMGGRLDATNILNNQAVSVISKIARDHESFLGGTLTEIARHKAGILRPNVPYIVNPENEVNVQAVIDNYAKEIGAGPRLFGDTPKLRKELYSREEWRRFAKPLQPFQRDNAVLAILAVKEVMKNLGGITDDVIVGELDTVRFGKFSGRMEEMPIIPVFAWDLKPGRNIIVDGSHNRDAALALNTFVDRRGRRKWKYNISPPNREGWPVTWVIAMTEGKDAESYLQALLRPKDKIITTTFGPVDGMPWVEPMDPEALLKIAQKVQPDITGLAIPERSALRALCAARYFTERDDPIVMTGSLYLTGDLYRELEGKTARDFWVRDAWSEERGKMKIMLSEERERISRFNNLQNPQEVRIKVQASDILSPDLKIQKLREKIDALEGEKSLLRIENQKASFQTPTIDSELDDAPSHSAVSPEFKRRFKDLRARENILKEEVKKHGVEGQDMMREQGPRIRMHFGVGENVDPGKTRSVPDRTPRHLFRPSFLTDRKKEE